MSRPAAKVFQVTRSSGAAPPSGPPPVLSAGEAVAKMPRILEALVWTIFHVVWVSAKQRDREFIWVFGFLCALLLYGISSFAPLGSSLCTHSASLVLKSDDEEEAWESQEQYSGCSGACASPVSQSRAS